MQKKVAILGASGLIGNQLLNLLIKDQEITQIIVLNRSALQYSDPKILQHTGQLQQINSEMLEGIDALYCCIGTTRKKSPDQNVYRSIDYGITLQIANTAKNAGIPEVHLISAMGANLQSRIFYNRLKAEIERDLLLLQFNRTLIYQPALLIGARTEKRTGEKFAQWISPLLDLLLFGKARRFHSIQAQDLAKAMRMHSFQSGIFQKTITYLDFFKP
jgi:uncharacterized protein YbjT (DUF2867 family)